MSSREQQGGRRPRGWVRRRRWGWYLAAARLVLVLVVLAVLGAAFQHYVKESPRFRVKKIFIQGAWRLEETVVREVAGITEDDVVLFFDAASVAARIEALPYVASCSVRRAFPDSVYISLEERKPVATLMTKNRTFELDASGVVLREIDALSPHPGPLITEAPGLDFVEPGERLDTPEVKAGLALWRALASVPITQETVLAEIAVPNPRAIRAYFDGLPFETRWGRGDFFAQVQRLQALWEHAGGPPPCQAYLDLRFGEDLVCM